MNNDDQSETMEVFTHIERGIDGVALTQRGQILTLSVIRPTVRNALNIATIQSFSKAISLAKTLSVGALILKGCDQYFLSGGDIKALHQLRSESDAKEFSALMQQSLNQLSALPYIVIAAIEGFAIGGGAEVALAADLRVISKTAFWRFPHTKLGLTTAWGGSQRLIELLGRGRTLQLHLDAADIPADQSLTLGLSHYIAPEGQAYQQAISLAEKVIRRGQALREIKLLAVDHTTTRPSIDLQEQERFAPLWASDDHWTRVLHLQKKNYFHQTLQ